MEYVNRTEEYALDWQILLSQFFRGPCTLGPAFNEFGYNEQIFLHKITDSNVKFRLQEEHQFATKNFLCISFLVVSGTQDNLCRVCGEWFNCNAVVLLTL